MNERQTDGPPEEEPQTPPEQQPDPTTEPQPSEAAAPGPAEKPGRRVGRIVLWCVLVVLVVLAFLDFRTKSAAQETGDDLRSALRENPIGTDLKASELGKYIQGEPTRETIENVPREMLDKLPQDLRLLVSTAAVYTWKGIFREYKVTVFFGLGSDPPVEAVEGPGQAPEQKKETRKKEKE